MSRTALDAFLASLESRAFRMARFSTGNDADACDVVQEGMLRFARNYADAPEEGWKPLFWRCLRSAAADFGRRERLRRGFRALLGVVGLGGDSSDEAGADPMDLLPDPGAGPESRVAADCFVDDLRAALAAMPGRQREVFLLRAHEGLSVQETATAMGCGEGSVKTHYSRALASLRERLKEHAP